MNRIGPDIFREPPYSSTVRKENQGQKSTKLFLFLEEIFMTGSDPFAAPERVILSRKMGRAFGIL